MDSDTETETDDLNPFHTAVCIGNLLSIKSYLKSNLYKIDEVNQHGKRAIHYAIEYDHIEILDYLVQQGANVDAAAGASSDSSGMAPLAIALLSDRKEMVRYLLGKGANPHIPVRSKLISRRPTHDGKVECVQQRWRMTTPLHIAACRGDVEMIEWFLGFMGSNNEINALDEEGYAPLHDAVFSCQAAVQRLVEAGADINVRSTQSRTPLLVAVSRKPCSKFKEATLRIVEWLINHGANVYATDTVGWCALDLAIAFGNFDLVKYLVSLGVDCSERALYVAVGHNQLEAAEYLLKIGTNPNWNDRFEGNSPLHIAASYGNMDCIALLIRHGADMNISRDDGSTPLHLAVTEMQLPVCKLLLENGADPNKKDENGWTPFLRAVYLRVKDQDYTDRMDEILTLLLEHDADVDASLHRGANALCLAVMDKDQGVVKFLCDRGAKVDGGGLGEHFVTPLRLAAAKGSVEMVNYLLGQCSRGTDIDDLIIVARLQKNHEVFQFLVKVKLTYTEEMNCIDCCAMV